MIAFALASIVFAANASSLPVEISRNSELTTQIVEKLTPEQLENVLREKMRAEARASENSLIPGSLFFFIVVIVVVCVTTSSRSRREKMRHETVRLMVEKNVQIPPEILQPTSRPSSFSLIHKALGLVGLGVSLMVAFAVSVPVPGLWAWGLVPTFVGIGILIADKLEKKAN